MRYEVSERLITTATKETLLTGLEVQFKKVAASVKRQGDEIVVESIEASFGSINRSDTTTVSIKSADSGYLVVADVHYRPSIAFWIIFIIIGLTSGIGWVFQIFFYITQKKTVRTAIEETFQRVKNEYMTTSTSAVSTNRSTGAAEELEKFASKYNFDSY